MLYRVATNRKIAENSANPTLAQISVLGHEKIKGREVFTFDMQVPDAAGKCRFVAELRGADGNPMHSLRDVRAR